MENKEKPITLKVSHKAHKLLKANTALSECRTYSEYLEQHLPEVTQK